MNLSNDIVEACVEAAKEPRQLTESQRQGMVDFVNSRAAEEPTLTEIKDQPAPKPVEQAKPKPGIRSFNITDEQVRFLANPSCKHCYGLGYIGEMKFGDEVKRVMCSCVHKSLALKGKTPWVERKERRLKKAAADAT